MTSEKTYVSEANQNAPRILEGFFCFLASGKMLQCWADWKPEISGTHGNQRGKLVKKLVNVLCLHYYETK